MKTINLATFIKAVAYCDSGIDDAHNPLRIDHTTKVKLPDGRLLTAPQIAAIRIAARQSTLSSYTMKKIVWLHAKPYAEKKSAFGFS
ncbi:MAG: hypothetical protein P1U34_04235 [Coxiellaceae bacterium]|nr:hypothetical protein [Coxiellaceae bacterium]